MTPFAFELGVWGKDIITGFEGYLTGRSQCLTGCNQYHIQPRASEGKYPSGVWMDEHRIVITPEVARIELPKIAPEVKGCDIGMPNM